MSEKVNKILYIVLSLLLAIAFWLFVDDALGNTMSESFTNVPVVFIGAEDTLPSRGLMLAEGGDATVDLRLSGPRSVITELKRGGVRVSVNLNDINAVGPYSRTYDLLTPDNVNKSDITVEYRSRINITVQITNLYSREIPVRMDVVGSVDEPYVHVAERQTKEPEVITLSGLQSDVDQVVSARVEVDINGATSTIRQEYSYRLLDADGNEVELRNMKVSDQRVNVTVPIHMMKTLPLNVKIKESAGSREANASWRLEPSSITVSGDPLSLETIDEIFMGEVDLSAYVADGDYEQEIKLPAECENISGNKVAILSIRFHGLDTRLLQVTNIKPTGLSERQSFDPITTSVDVLLRGPAEDLEQVTAEDVRIVVDLSEYTSDGTVTIPATVFVDGYSEVGAISAYNVTGKIISR